MGFVGSVDVASAPWWCRLNSSWSRSASGRYGPTSIIRRSRPQQATCRARKPSLMREVVRQIDRRIFSSVRSALKRSIMDITRMQAALMLESGIGHRRIWAAGRRSLAVTKFTPKIRSRRKSDTRVRAAAGTPGSGQSQADRQTAGREPIEAHGMERSRSPLLRPVSSLRCDGCAE
jgi:hypothetical protein